MNNKIYKKLIAKLLEEAKGHYGARLVTFAIFGSFARNDMRNDSDLDILIVARGLPKGRMKRVGEFMELERKLAPLEKELAERNVHPCLSPIFKTPEEAAHGSLLFLDMTEEIEIYFDENDFFKRTLDHLKKRLLELGSRRVWKGKMWYWILKPDLQPGEVIAL